jgi:hypothetical protein
MSDKIPQDQNLDIDNMKKESKSISSSDTDKLEELQRKAYLSSKGIKPNAQFQLDVFDIVANNNDLRHIPNEYARSSLFTVRNKSDGRVHLLQTKLFHYNEYITIEYTGQELRAEDDEIIWLQILNYGKNVPLGEEFEIEIKNIVKDVGWSKSGRNYERVRECVKRLRGGLVVASNSKAYGRSPSLNLIKEETGINDKNGKIVAYKIIIDKHLQLLFAGNTFTSHKWEIYRDLSPVARRLADYIGSHRHPYPLDIEKFRQICGSTYLSKTGWRRIVKNACAEIQDTGEIADQITILKDKIICNRVLIIESIPKIE